MIFIHKALTAIGLILLTHAIYSAYEHSLLQRGHQTIRIPPDIVIEAFSSTGLLLVVVVLSSAPLRPINWADWAGKIEREGWDPNVPADEAKRRQVAAGETSGAMSRGGKGNPYKVLEERRGFLDIRAQRNEFADWVRSGRGIDVTRKGKDALKPG